MRHLGPVRLDIDAGNAVWVNPSMADIGRPDREIEVRPAELPLPREIPVEARDEALAYLEATRDAAPLLFVRRPARALGIAFGRVSGWGRAIAHTRGWRSEFAYPFDLELLKGDRPLALALAGRYGVEVAPDPTDS